MDIEIEMNEEELDSPVGEILTLQLPRHFVGQIIDGLDILIEQWEYTADSLEFGAFRDDVMIRECSDPEEARWIAGFYALIRARVAAQLASRVL